MYKATIGSTQGFSPNSDAERLKQAIFGKAVDEQTIINILGRRTSAERLAIRQAFASISRKSLKEALSSVLSGDFRDLAIMLTKTPWEIMAEALYKAMRGAATKERVLNEILASCSREDIPEIKKIYEQIYKRHTLENDIHGDTSGNYRKALLAVLEAQMDEPSAFKLKNLSPYNVSEIVNHQVAEIDTEEILSEGKCRVGNEESRYMRLIINRSPWQLYVTDHVYQRKSNHSLDELIRRETSGDFKNFLLARYLYAVDRPTFYAKLLHFAIAGPGTRDATLQRVLVLRSDIDLESIKERYQELYKESLSKAIFEDTTREYRKLCLTLIDA